MPEREAMMHHGLDRGTGAEFEVMEFMLPARGAGSARGARARGGGSSGAGGSGANFGTNFGTNLATNLGTKPGANPGANPGGGRAGGARLPARPPGRGAASLAGMAAPAALIGRGRRPAYGPWRHVVPPSLLMLHARHPERLPHYRHVGKLCTVYNLAQNEGLYYLEFTINGTTRGYSGMSADLARRLKAHRLCATVMGVDPAGIDVYVATDPLDATWRERERALHLLMRQISPGVLTNQRLEL